MPLVETESLEPGIALIALNRPERKNAINFELVGELHAALDAVAADQRCKVAILTGRGIAFCSGLDLKSWGTLPDIGTDPYRNAGSTGQSYLSSLVAHVRRTPQIVIASINGAAFGGGLALSLACDLRFASASATLCAAFIRTGLTATDVGISYFLPRLIGAARAFDLMVTGRTIDGATAERMGIVSQVYGDDELMALTLETARTIAAYTGVGLRLTKQAMWANLDAPSLESCLALEDRNQDLAGASEEVLEYMESYRSRFSGKG